MAFTLIVSGGKLNAQNAVFDTSFNIGTGFNNTVSSMVLQPDGKILASGHFTQYNGQSRNRIVRINMDGTFDNSFTIGTGFNSFVVSIALQPDGKILAGGNFTSYNGQSRNRIVRLNADGTLDASFNLGTGFPTTVSVIALQPDGKILAGGHFVEYNGQARNKIVRLNVDGTLDTSFTIGTGFDNWINVITVQPDGKILVGGNFTSYNGQSQNYIARLNADGTLDTSFNIGTGFNSPVIGIALQSDGKILAGGGFTEYNTISKSNFVRLNTDGTIDNSFEAGFNGFVAEVILQPDGKILAGGGFTECNGIARRNFARLNADGTLDNTFNIGTGFENGGVTSIGLQSDGKILVAGSFNSYNGQSQNRMVRLIDSTTLGAEDFGRKGLKIYPNPFADYIFIDAGNGKISKIEILDSSGKKVTSYTNPSISIDLKMLSKGIYFLRITKKDGSILTKKIIKK